MSRLATVASINRGPGPDEAADPALLLERAESFVLSARRRGADLVVFPEVYAHLGQPFEQIAEIAQPLDGPSVTAMGQVAARHGCYVVWCLWERAGDRLLNTAVLLDRSGGVVGKYSKMFPTTGEIELGISPGDEATVLSTDFGKVGFAICFDMNFTPLWQGLHDNGAELVCFMSMFRAGVLAEARAIEYGYSLLTAITGELGRVIDLTGQVLRTSHQDFILAHRLNFNRRLLHMDFNWEKTEAILEKYGPDVTFDVAAPEGRYALGSLREGLEADQIIDEFGLERLDAYWARAQRMIADARASSR